MAAGLSPDPRWGSYSAPPYPLAVIKGRGGKEGEGKGWKYGGRKGREGKGKREKQKGSGMGETVGKREGELNMDICPGGDLLVTPLNRSQRSIQALNNGLSTSRLMAICSL